MAFCSIRIGLNLLHISCIHFPVVHQSASPPLQVSITAEVVSLIVVVASFTVEMASAVIDTVIIN